MPERSLQAATAAPSTKEESSAASNQTSSPSPATKNVGTAAGFVESSLLVDGALGVASALFDVDGRSDALPSTLEAGTTANDDELTTSLVATVSSGSLVSMGSDPAGTLEICSDELASLLEEEISEDTELDVLVVFVVLVVCPVVGEGGVVTLGSSLSSLDTHALGGRMAATAATAAIGVRLCHREVGELTGLVSLPDLRGRRNEHDRSRGQAVRSRRKLARKTLRCELRRPGLRHCLACRVSWRCSTISPGRVTLKRWSWRLAKKLGHKLARDLVEPP